MKFIILFEDGNLSTCARIAELFPNHLLVPGDLAVVPE